MKQMSYEFYVDVKLLFQMWKFTLLWDSLFFLVGECENGVVVLSVDDFGH